MPLSTIICAMFRRYLKSFKKNGSRYIAWNVLFLWGFGLWIALCTSNMYHEEDATEEEAALFCLQNSTLGIEYDASPETEAIQEMLHVTTANQPLYNLILTLKTVLQYVYVLVSTSFVILFACSNEYMKRVTRVWKDAVSNFCAVASRFTIFLRNYNLYDDINDRAISEPKHDGNSEINEDCMETEFRYEGKNGWTLEQSKCIKKSDINIVQSEIMFSSYTLLLFNNYDLCQYFRNPLLKSRSSNKHLLDQRSEQAGRSLKVTNNYKKHNTICKKIVRRGIVSSSPEFQKFLANLKRSQLIYPCTLEVSTDYVVRIKSIYK